MSHACPENTGADPRTVIAPQRSWQLIAVLYENKHWSMALGRWRNDDDGLWKPALAQRWNGWDGSKGNPVSRGYSTWFVLPEETHDLYLQTRFIPDNLRDLVIETLNRPGSENPQDVGPGSRIVGA